MIHISQNHKILYLIIDGKTDTRHIVNINTSNFSDVEVNLLSVLKKILEDGLEISAVNIFKMASKDEASIYIQICNEIDCKKYKIKRETLHERT